MLTDTHVHFDLLEARGDCGTMADLLRKAGQAGVRRMLAVGGTPAANRRAAALARAYPERIDAAAALGRDQSPDPAALRELESILESGAVVAVGETGLDYHYGDRHDPGPRRVFRAMLELARRYRLPVIVHSRAADDEVRQDLAAHASAWCGPADAVGVMHCFTGDSDCARRLLDLGFYISFSGIVTFKNAAELRRTAAAVPGERLLLETDAPYLAPEPLRGRVNEPARLPLIADCLAAVRGTTPDGIADLTTANAARLFRQRRRREATAPATATGF